jgi:hypothetical protein
MLSGRLKEGDSGIVDLDEEGKAFVTATHPPALPVNDEAPALSAAE